MSTERPEEFAQPAVRARQTSENPGLGDDATHREATVLVRGETIYDQEPKSSHQNSPPSDKDKTPRKEVSEAKIKAQSRLPSSMTILTSAFRRNKLSSEMAKRI